MAHDNTRDPSRELRLSLLKMPSCCDSLIGNQALYEGFGGSIAEAIEDRFLPPEGNVGTIPTQKVNL
jgi:hypothetical protein